MTQPPYPANAYPSNSNPAPIDPIVLEPEPPYPCDTQDTATPENPYKLEDTVLWKRHETSFQPGFLIQHKDVILYDILNRIKAFLLYPPIADAIACVSVRKNGIR